MLGSLHVAASLAPLRMRVALYVAITVLSGALAFAVAYLLVVRVRREVDATENRLDYLAFFDPVTGLRNRHAAVDALRALIERPDNAAPAGFALLLVDLDDFKVINDTLGHAAGDTVLQAVAARLTKYVQSEARVFRFGGDEFLIIATGDKDAAQLRLLGQSVGVALEEPIEVADQLIHVRSSVGIARFPLDATAQAALMRAADTAMYAAKALGKNTFEVFRAEMETHAQNRIRLDNDLRRAIERDELHLVYQPIVQLPSQRLVGVEALLRWTHPELGLVSPAEFVPIAERSGQIVDIGQWVLHAGCRQLKAWADAGHDDVYLAVNVSARQLRRGLTAQVEAALAASGADPAALEIEITEHSMVEDIDSNVAQLSALRARGLKIAVDDFGTGLSSLAYLKRLPINKLKVDRAFIKDLPQGGDDAAIVAAIASMAHSLHLTLIAEGVETEAQQRFLAAQGCELIQGYLYSRPVPAETVTGLLVRQKAGEPMWTVARPELAGRSIIRLAGV
jgi:diguanylate cyclase (GGDEF)-like protein